jgi:hypothetical protein
MSQDPSRFNPCWYILPVKYMEQLLMYDTHAKSCSERKGEDGGVSLRMLQFCIEKPFVEV